jgi:hypothetical protein
MYPERDSLYNFAIWVSGVAILLRILSIVAGIGGPSLPWIAGLVFVIAFGGVIVRARLKARSVVWTGEMREARRQRARQEARNNLLRLIPTGVLMLGLLIVTNLVDSAGLLRWIGSIAVVPLLALNIWLWRVVNRIKA